MTQPAYHGNERRSGKNRRRGAATQDYLLKRWLFDRWSAASFSARGLVVVSTVGVLFFVFAAWFLATHFPLPDDKALRPEYFEHYVGVAKLVGGSIVVALLAAFIPWVVPEARDRFERYKESRRAYSVAKTAALYLADNVLRSDPKEAFKLIAAAHQDLHFAETFEPEIERYLGWFSLNPRAWIPYNYWRIQAVVEVLRAEPLDWVGEETRAAVRERLHKAIARVERDFDPFGDPQRGGDWRHGGVDRKRVEGAVEASIRAFVQGEDLERLRRMNEEFAQRENAGDKAYFEKRLAEHFSMLRADGTLINGEQFIAKLKSGGSRKTLKIDWIDRTGSDRALVRCRVRVVADSKDYDNVRLFVRHQDAPEGWALLSWANEEIGQETSGSRAQ